MPWIPLGTETSTVDGNYTLTLSESKDFVQGIYHVLPTGGTLAMGSRTSPPPSGNVYNFLQAFNGAADVGNNNNSFIPFIESTALDEAVFANMIIQSIQGEEKAMLIEVMLDGGDTAADVPNRLEIACKSTDTNQMTALQAVLGFGTGSIGTGSNTTAFGSN